MKRTVPILVMSLLCIVSLSVAGRRGHQFDPKKLVGNVSGRVIESDNGAAIEGAEVCLQAVGIGVQDSVMQLDNQLVPLPTLFNPKRITDEHGRFLINFVPSPDGKRVYSLLVKASGFVSCLLKAFVVPAGACMSPELTVSLVRGSASNEVVEKEALDSILAYGTLLSATKVQSKKASASLVRGTGLTKPLTVGASVFATQEGLVGRTTANGHIITASDHFCALPSSDVLSDDQSTAFNVTIYHNSIEVSNIPVWDVGPWNIHDDYWVPESERSIYQYLSHGGQPGLGQYVPEAEAAHDASYNGGYSEPLSGYSNGQVPSNPSGIDLADGTFADLGFTGNDYGEVVYNWLSTYSIIQEDIKQTEDWFGAVSVQAKSGGSTSIHIKVGQTVDVIAGCNLELDPNVRLVVDAGSTLILEKGMVKDFGQGAGIDVASGGTLIDLTTPTGTEGPPAPPADLRASISGQDIVLTWHQADPWGYSVWRQQGSGGTLQQIGSLSSSAQGFTDTGGLARLTSSQSLQYQVWAFNGSSNAGISTVNALVAPSSVTTITSWSGLVYVPNTITIGSTAILTIGIGTNVLLNTGTFTVLNNAKLILCPGVTFTCCANTSFNLQGKISALGLTDSHIKMTSATTWSGLYLGGSGANNSLLRHVDIDHVQTYGGSAVSICATGVTVQHCNISNNVNYGTAGLCFSNAGNPDVSYNRIDGNGSAGVSFYNTNGYFYKDTLTNNGVNCSYYASPGFGKPGFTAYNGNNVLSGTNAGVVVAGYSYPLLGSQYNTSYGYNSIVPTSGYRVSATGNSTVLAEENWWGGQPNSSWFSATQNSSIDWQPYLTGNSNQAPQPPVASASNVTAAATLPTSGIRLAIELRAMGDLAGAKRELLAETRAVLDSLGARSLALELLNLHRGTKDHDLLGLCDSLRRAFGQSDPFFSLVCAQMLSEEGNTVSAAGLFNQVAAKYPSSDAEKEALLSLFYLYWNDDAHSTLARDITAKLTKAYGQDKDVTQAIWLYGLSNHAASSDQPSADDSLIVAGAGLELLQNYPNPFNPSTTIRFGLPSAGNVSLIIYDVLGREITTLARGTLDAGYHTAIWNASSVASGVYFARLTVTNEFGKVAFNKVTKLLLMK